MIQIVNIGEGNQNIVEHNGNCANCCGSTVINVNLIMINLIIIECIVRDDSDDSEDSACWVFRVETN